MHTDSEGEEAKAEEKPQVANEGENPHCRVSRVRMLENGV